MKVVNQVNKFVRETRGHQLNVTVAEAQLLHDFAIWLDKQSAQHSVQRTAESDEPLRDDEFQSWHDDPGLY